MTGTLSILGQTRETIHGGERRAVSTRVQGEVLGNFERLQLNSLAGEAPLDDVEFLADRINEASEKEIDAVEQLSRAIEESAGPVGA